MALIVAPVEGFMSAADNVKLNAAPTPSDTLYRVATAPESTTSPGEAGQIFVSDALCTSVLVQTTERRLI